MVVSFNVCLFVWVGVSGLWCPCMCGGVAADAHIGARSRIIPEWGGVRW